VRVLHLTDRFGARGGAHRHLEGVASWLVERGHDVHVAAGEGEGFMAPYPTSLVAGLAAREPAEVELGPLVESFRPDVVHLHTIMNPTVLEWAVARPAVITVQDHRYFCPARGKWTLGGAVCREAMSASACADCFEDDGYFRDMLALTQRRLNGLRPLHIVVLSAYMKNELTAAGVPEPSVAVLPPFVHGLDPQAAADGPPCVAFIGRLAAHKGAREAVDAWRRSGVNLPLVFAGTGPLRTELETAGAQVLGWLDPDALSRVYRRARAVLMPSRWQEPFGIVGLEALTMGVPVVGWASGGMAEWHRGPGLVPWGDVDALAAALRDVVESPPAIATPSFDRDVLMDRLLDVYRRVAR
jgi:glycosyltransferase involved in cell wall biosynthesis